MTAVHLATELSSPNVRVAAFIGCTIITHPLGIELQKQKDEIRDERRGMVGAGERSEKIRTYNFPQNRVIDHRIGLTLHKLDRVVDGDLDELVGAVIAWHQAARASRATNPSSERARRETAAPPSG